MPQEATVAQTGDLQNGEMKQVKVGETDVLLTKIDGDFYATYLYCTHLGANLTDGVLVGQQVMCPFHHACFDLTSGRYTEPPAIDDLPSYPVRIEGSDVIVSVPDAAPEEVTPAMADVDSSDGRHFVILGAGAAGGIAAETLRELGFGGQITVVTRENNLFYDRTQLSKGYLAEDSETPTLRSADFYQQHDIDFRSGSTVQRVSLGDNQVTLENGDAIDYDALLIATGSTPKTPPIDGLQDENVADKVFTLRTPPDADQIIAAAKAGDKAVLIGASFIAMECASALGERDVAVTVVAPEEVPFGSRFGDQVGKMLQQKHEAKGVTFQLGVQAEKITRSGSGLTVTLDDDTTLDADFVVLGVGVQPVTDFLDLDKNKDGSLSVDANLRLQQAGGAPVFAAGDIAEFPDKYSGARVRIEHWRLAQQHGRVAAQNMIAATSQKAANGDSVATLSMQPFDKVPFFWSKQPGFNLRYVGHVEEFDDVIIDGDLDKPEFIAFYVKDGAIRAALGAKRDTEMVAVNEAMRLGRVPSVKEVRKGGVDWVALVK